MRLTATIAVGLVVSACGGPAASVVAPQPTVLASAVVGASCAPLAADPSGRAEVLVRHPSDGYGLSFALSLPPPWAEIDLTTGSPTDQFRSVTMPSGWDVPIAQIAQGAAAANSSFLAVDLSPDTPTSDGHPLFSDLNVALRDGDGVAGPLTEMALVSIAKHLGATDGIETASVRIDGSDGVAVLYPTVQQFQDGQTVEATVSLYGELRGTVAYLLVFNGPRGAGTAVIDAIAESFTLDVPSSPCLLN